MPTQTHLEHSKPLNFEPFKMPAANLPRSYIKFALRALRSLSTRQLLPPKSRRPSSKAPKNLGLGTGLKMDKTLGFLGASAGRASKLDPF